METVHLVIRTVLNKTSKVVLGACTCAVLIYPSGFILRFLAGAAINSILVKVLKRVFNEQRPQQALREGHRDPGNPSAHAHMLSYGAAHISMELCLTKVKLAREVTVNLGPFSVVGAVCMLEGLAIGGGAWRVVMKRHTVKQVVTGWVTGLVGGIVWWGAQHWMRHEPVDIDAEVELLVAAHPMAFRLSVVSLMAAASFLLKRYSDWITMGRRKESK